MSARARIEAAAAELASLAGSTADDVLEQYDTEAAAVEVFVQKLKLALANHAANVEKTEAVKARRALGGRHRAAP